MLVYAVYVKCILLLNLHSYAFYKKVFTHMQNDNTISEVVKACNNFININKMFSFVRACK